MLIYDSSTKFRSAISLASFLWPLLTSGCSSSFVTSPSSHMVPTQRILFVGDSYTHGRYLPVRTYNNTPGTGGLGSTAASPLVVDEDFNTTMAARAESQSEYGPWGGIPGMFAELAAEAGLPYDVHIEAISATSLSKNYQAAKSVIVQPLWNTVVLQEATFEPIPPSLSGNSTSNPATFCSAVSIIEQAIHAVSSSANVYLYETGAPADTAYVDSTSSGTFSDSAYLTALTGLTNAYHDAYLTAAAQDGHIAGVAATGDAWARAWSEGIANPDPYGGTATGVSLTFNDQASSQPSTTTSPTDAGFHHPSMFGAYLNGLVLFQKVTGTDVRTFGGTEKAALSLGIPAANALQPQRIAWETVTQQSTSLVHPTVNACQQPQSALNNPETRGRQ